MNHNNSMHSPSVESLRSWIIGRWAEELGLAREAVDPDRSFLSYGMDSVQAMSLVGELETKLNQRLPPTLVWDYPDINALTEHLANLARAESAPSPAIPAAQSSPEAADTDAESLLATIDQMSDREVDRLLERFRSTS
jgi:acyl carrier protein